MFFEQTDPGCENRFLKEIRSDKIFGAGIIDKSGKRTDQTDLLTDHYTLVYLLNGNAEYIDYTEKKYFLKAGDYFQRIPGYRHTTLIDSNSSYKEFYVTISMKCFEACREIGFIPLDPPVGTLGPSLETVSRFLLLRKHFQKSSSEDIPELAMECQNFIFKFFIAVRNRKFGSYYSELISKACKCLVEDFETPPDLEKFCRRNGCSYHSFRRRFKERIGLSPAKYRIQRRLDTAYSLLKQEQLSISEISWKLGYSSPFEFSNQFKKYFGTAPSFLKKENS